jgi:hypothetical protein
VPADLRAERLIAGGDLRRRVFDYALGGLQPSRPVAVAVALAFRRPMLVIVAPDGVARLRGLADKVAKGQVATRTITRRAEDMIDNPLVFEAYPELRRWSIELTCERKGAGRARRERHLDVLDHEKVGRPTFGFCHVLNVRCLRFAASH